MKSFEKNFNRFSSIQTIKKNIFNWYFYNDHDLFLRAKPRIGEKCSDIFKAEASKFLSIIKT